LKIFLLRSNENDLIVDFKKLAIEDYSDNYFDFKFPLEDIFD